MSNLPKCALRGIWVALSTAVTCKLFKKNRNKQKIKTLNFRILSRIGCPLYSHDTRVLYALIVRFRCLQLVENIYIYINIMSQQFDSFLFCLCVIIQFSLSNSQMSIHSRTRSQYKPSSPVLGYRGVQLRGSPRPDPLSSSQAGCVCLSLLFSAAVSFFTVEVVAINENALGAFFLSLCPALSPSFPAVSVFSGTRIWKAEVTLGQIYQGFLLCVCLFF